MGKQANNFSHRQVPGITARPMLRMTLAGVAALLMCASFIFSGNVSAHNIDLAKAREAAREYARRVREESNGKYAHYSTNCVRSNPGHNHFVSCMIDFQSEADAAKGVYTCREAILIYMPPHHNDQYFFVLYGKHASRNYCGRAPLDESKPIG